MFSIRFFLLATLIIALSVPVLANDKNIDKTSDTKIELLTKKDIRLIEAEQLVRQEKYVDAIILVEDIIRADARTDEAYLLAAYSYMKLKKLNKARQTLINAQRLSPRNRAAQNYAGRLALLNEEPRDAKRNLNALKTICGGTDCLEYRDLQYRIKEYELEEKN